MKRRHVVALVGFFSLGGAAALWRLLQPLRRRDPREHIARTVAAVAEAMFPGDGLPGASELGIHRRVLAMADLQASIAAGVSWLDQRAALRRAADFAALDETQRLAVLDAAFASPDPGNSAIRARAPISPGDGLLLGARDQVGLCLYRSAAAGWLCRLQGTPGISGESDWDVIVVGAGAGGAAAAYGLCRRGRSVLLLDAGPRFDPSIDYPLTESDWDSRQFPQKPGSTGKVTFAPGQKLGSEPLLASGSSDRTARDRRRAADGPLSPRSRHRRQHAALHRRVASPASRGDENENALRRRRRLAARLCRARTILCRGRAIDRRGGAALARCALALARISAAAASLVLRVANPRQGSQIAWP